MSCVVVSYNTHVGLAFETDGNSPYRDAATGTVAANGAAAPTVFLPLAGDESLSSVPNYQDLPQPEGVPYLSKYQSMATRVEGTIPLTVPPGLMTTIYQWAFERTTVLGCVDQLRSATVWITVGGIITKRFIGVKVNTGEFNLQKGQPLQVNLNVSGFGEEHISPIAFSAPSWWHDAVYAGDSCAIEIPSGTAARNVDAVRWTINNKLDDEPHRLWNSNFPRRMYARDREVTGGFDADYLNNVEYARFLAGTVGSLNVSLAKTIGGTGYTAGFLFPRIRYDGYGGVYAGASKDRIIKQNVDFRAMGGRVGVDGTLAELVWS